MTAGGARIHFTDVFDVDPSTLDEHGAFDISLINDLPLFVDPFLLFNSEKQAYQDLHRDVLRYLAFLRDVATEESVGSDLLKAWYMFPEIRQNWLGFSRVGNRGTGLGIDFARALHANLKDVLSDFGSETVTRSSHLEKLCLIKDGVGRDTISDFVTNLIQGYFLDYTQDFAREHIAAHRRRLFRVSRAGFNYESRSWYSADYELPEHDGDFVLLTPRDLLTRDETWICKDDLLHQFHKVAQALPDEVLRAQLNDYFRRRLPAKAKAAAVREAKAATVRMYPALIDYYIKLKEDEGDKAASVSDERVRGVEQVFIENLRRLTAVLAQDTGFYSIRGDTHDEARRRVEFLKDVIENKGGHRIFFDNKKRLVGRESDLQILFRLCWFGTAFDVSREVNDGRGPVDFKVSFGATNKSLVEFKLASNSQLKRNLQKQVAIYEKASDAKRSLKVILAFSKPDKRRVAKVLKELKLEGHPDVFVIDADPANKPSGSKA